MEEEHPDTLDFEKEINGHLVVMCMNLLQDSPVDLAVFCETCAPDEPLVTFDCIFTDVELVMEQAFEFAEAHAEGE